MPNLKPCAWCEEELSTQEFEHPGAPFCKKCMPEAMAVVRSKYGIIEAAHFRAQLRHKTRHLDRPHVES